MNIDIITLLVMGLAPSVIYADRIIMRGLCATTAAGNQKPVSVITQNCFSILKHELFERFMERSIRTAIETERSQCLAIFEFWGINGQ